MQNGNNQKIIVFTGGGSAGHVTPNLSLIDQFKKEGWVAHYLGSKNGIEKQIIEKFEIPYHAISTGKLRRYFSWQNFLDIFKVILGIVNAIRLLRKIKANIIFSKGGFVAFPVVFAAWILRIPVIIHESDLTPGLANKLCFPFSNEICVTFAETKNHLKDDREVIVSGTPIRKSLFKGDKERGKLLCGFQDDKKILLVAGGGLGSHRLNEFIRSRLDQLLPEYNIIHLCGNGKTDSSYDGRSGYKQFPYVDLEYADLMASADIVISRAGANAIYELLTLNKPHILIPLPSVASRGDQIQNANYFSQQGLSFTVFDEDIESRLMDAIKNCFQNFAEIKEKISGYKLVDSQKILFDLINKTAFPVPPQEEISS